MDIQKIKELLHEVQEYKKQLQGKWQRTGIVIYKLDYACKLRVLDLIESRLDKIENLLSIEKYNLAFIGQIGIGKTTAICHLFDLVFEEEKFNNAKRISEIFSTGSGRTTICEVVIKSSESKSSYIEIEPYDVSEIEEFIKEFCTYYWSKYRTILDAEHQHKIPEELNRAIMNMANLRADQKSKSINRIDNLIRKINSCEEFTKIVLERVELEKRVKSKIQISRKNISVVEEKIWLQEKFLNLNLGKEKLFLLPKRIYISVNKKIIDFQKYNNIKSIIDTRGIDRFIDPNGTSKVNDREDLSNYIRNENDTICLFAEDFNSAPLSTTPILKRYLTAESKDIKDKVILFVLPHKGQPEKVIGQDGRVNTREEGIHVKENQILDSLNKEKICFNSSNNIIFYDALQVYDEHNVLKYYHQPNDVVKSREIILVEINKVIERRRANLIEEARQLKLRFNLIKNGKAITPEEKALIEDLKKKIDDNYELKQYNSFENNFKDSLRSNYATVLRAINNRFGIYTLRGKDIYFDSTGITENIIRMNWIKPKSEISGAIQLIIENSDKNSVLKPVMETFLENIDETFEDLIISIGNQISQEIKFNRLSPQDYTNEFWTCIQGRWGRGSGYMVDVIREYIKQLTGIDLWLNNIIIESWQEDFIGNILRFLEE